MTKINIPLRKPIFIAGEGDSERSFVTWLQQLSNQQGLHIHLECQTLDGGGYKTMLERAVRERKRKERSKAKFSILLVDGDRAGRDDPWSLEQLKQEAKKHKIIVCIQHPNLEGLFLRLMPGKESLRPDAANVLRQLRGAWPNYEKPADARTLAGKFRLNDLLRVAKVDSELNTFLSIIGLSDG